MGEKVLQGNEIYSSKVESEGVQNIPPHNIPLWHIDYFDLKALRNGSIRRVRFTLERVQN